MSPTDPADPGTSLRVFPLPSPSPLSTPLSILDSACAEFAPCGAVWLFSPPPSPPSPSSPPYSPSLLVTALEHVLTIYPHFCGTLRHPFPPPPLTSASSGSSLDRPYTHRFGRVWVDYGGPSSSHPGVDVTFSTLPQPLTTMYPTSVGPGIFDASIPSNPALFPTTPLVKLGDAGSPGPAVVIRVTSFECGGLAIGIKMHHALSDAQSLSTFVNDWTTIYRSLSTSPTSLSTYAKLPPLPSRPFSPSLLDSHALGSLDGPLDPSLNSLAISLPQLRLDFWSQSSSAGAMPSFFKAAQEPHASIDALDAESGRERGTPVPWKSWDHTVPVKDYLVDFSKEEIEACYRDVLGAVDKVGGETTTLISRLDALLGRVWRCIVRARDLDPDTAVSIDMSLGIRPRVDPPLPPTFIGSTLVNCSATLRAADVVSTTPTRTTTTTATTTTTTPTPALAIRHTLQQFTPPRVGALLHRMAHALDPVREWNCFMGSEHVMLTSWLGIQAYGVDLGAGRASEAGQEEADRSANPAFARPALVHASMPLIDGLVVIMEHPSVATDPGIGMDGAAGRWYAHGAVVRLMLREDVMMRVMADPELRTSTVA